MAKLPDVSFVASELRTALDEGRKPDAKHIAVKHLRAGYHSQAFLNIVADMLEIKKQPGKLGRKPQKSPPYWLEIGSEIEKLHYKMTIEEAVQQLKTKYGSRNTIQEAWAYFRKARKEHDEIR